jgi:CheY-like chemotaxis protein
MPGMDGYEVARRVRAAHPRRPPAIVALSGWGQDADRERSRDAGIDRHLVKPVDLAALTSLIASLKP